jgi:hypothetical protein
MHSAKNKRTTAAAGGATSDNQTAKSQWPNF